ncbi:hypothetical protein JRO89_XS11G0136200 [Xanthoceras sorbifolium]|uniref:Uncharacterized protein n=1 Tax=Xanthoceras sorbifolium TaxID=99658 RepID=A0ABQ8HFH8_9ROSI|nr:hypothetical protein JRO89_XS11G0136200 [Xanthoceras sorbifolium]
MVAILTMQIRLNLDIQSLFMLQLVGLDLYYANEQMPLVQLSLALSQPKRSKWFLKWKFYPTQGSLACLKMRDYTVSFGQVSGLVDPVPISALQPKSLFLTRASLALYMLTQEELLVTAREVFANVASCVLLVRVSHAYPLSQAAQADAALESRKTSGSLVLLP